MPGSIHCRTEQTRIKSCSEGTRRACWRQFSNGLPARRTMSESKAYILAEWVGRHRKSTIAKTIAKWAHERESWGEDFFFARDVKELSDPSIVFPTLAFQIAQFRSPIQARPFRCSSSGSTYCLGRVGDAIYSSYHKTLLACDKERHTLIVLDALDECSGEDDVETILRVLLHSAGSACPNLRILIASRPRRTHPSCVPSAGWRKLSREICSPRHRRRSRSLRHPNVLENGIRRVSPPETFLNFPKDWPPPEQFNRLLDHCGKFFAYAATAVRFIGDKGCTGPKWPTSRDSTGQGAPMRRRRH